MSTIVCESEERTSSELRHVPESEPFMDKAGCVTLDSMRTLVCPGLFE